MGSQFEMKEVILRRICRVWTLRHRAAGAVPDDVDVAPESSMMAHFEDLEHEIAGGKFFDGAMLRASSPCL